MTPLMFLISLPVYLYGRVLSSVTVSHQETSPRDSRTLAPPDRKRTHTLSSTVRKDENRVLRETHSTNIRHTAWRFR